MIRRELSPALVRRARLTVPAIADEVPKPNGMKLIYQHDFDDIGNLDKLDNVRIYVPE